MSLTCSISNEVPEKPVISPLSGHIFERRLIEKYIEENGTDPINGESMTVEQLVEVKTAPYVQPRTTQALSIPSLIKMLQDEWDAVMLQSFVARQQLHTARQELSHAMYQHDAACRVIARLSNEVTASREALATLKPHEASAVTGGEAMDADGGTDAEQTEEGMTDAVIQKLTDKAQALTAVRKQRGKQLPEGLTKAEQFAEFVQQDAHMGLHSAGAPGVTCVDVKQGNEHMMVTGGNDKAVVVFDSRAQKVVTTLKGHTKRVNKVIFHRDHDLVVSCSNDHTVKVWQSTADGKCVSTIGEHAAAVTDISLHATGDYVLSVGADRLSAFSDLRTGRTLTALRDQDSQQFTAAQFHPDGLIFGTGANDAIVKIWDVKEQTNVAKFPGHSGGITALAFSENGYYLATAAEDQQIKLWDLRKLKNFKSIQLDTNYEVNDLTFDQSGTYLACAGTDVRVYVCKAWTEAVVLREHTDLAEGVRFGCNAAQIVSVGRDRSLRIFSAPA